MTTWTDDDLAKFYRITRDLSSSRQIERIAARLDIKQFEAMHGTEKCKAMFAVLKARETSKIVYRSRRGAVRAARNACKKALDAPGYQAYEGPDYIIHPVNDDTLAGGTYEGPSRFELRGPALEATKKAPL